MPLESQKGEKHFPDTSLVEQSLQSSLEKNQSNLKKNEAENIYVERVVAEATQQAYETEQPIQFTIKISKFQEKMAAELRQALGLGFEVTLNSAIKYALFYAQNKGVSISELEEYPSHLGSDSLKMKVTPDTLHRLKESSATNQLSECVVVGIQLLYQQLIDLKANHEYP